MKRRLKMAVTQDRRPPLDVDGLTATRQELPPPVRASLDPVEDEPRQLRSALALRSRELIQTRAELKALGLALAIDDSGPATRRSAT
jgi:hypothetical protein